MGMANFMIEIFFMMRKAEFVTLTKHSLSKDTTQGKEGHDGAEVQV